MLRIIGTMAVASATANSTCSDIGIEKVFGSTLIANRTLSTPPSSTRYEVYFNPCGVLDAPAQCDPDSSLCVIEHVEHDGQWLPLGIMSLGGPIHVFEPEDFGAQDEVQEDERQAQNRDDGEEQEIVSGPDWGDFALGYNGMIGAGVMSYWQPWGDFVAQVSVLFLCDPSAIEPKLEIAPNSELYVQSAAICARAYKLKKEEDAEFRGPHFLLKKILVLVLIGSVGGIAAIVVLRYAFASRVKRSMNRET